MRGRRESPQSPSSGPLRNQATAAAPYREQAVRAATASAASKSRAVYAPTPGEVPAAQAHLEALPSRAPGSYAPAPTGAFQSRRRLSLKSLLHVSEQAFKL